ncbi:MAG: tetratricopeptide repeat protein [Planctomycetota bacterium]|nr:tetratricopeptide repeat protein [Planctomycetota bacterium]
MLVAFIIVGVAAFSARPAWIAYQLHQAKSAIDDDRPQEAIDRLEAALEYDADNAELHFWMARALRHAGRFEAINHHLQLARTNAADVGRLQREQWLVLAQSGRLREVERHLPALLQSAGDDGREICQAYCYGYLLNLRTNEALTLIDVWQKDFPQDPRPHFMRGLAMQMLSRFPESAAAIRAGLAIAPNRSQMQLRLGEILTELREFEDAAAAFEKCLEGDPNDANALIGRAHCLYNLGQADEARVIAQRVCDTTKDHFDALALLGEIELASRRFKTAAAALEAASKLRPKDVTVRYGLAQALQALDENAEAAKHFEYVAVAQQQLALSSKKIQDALELPNDAKLRVEIGEILLQYGEPNDAARWLRAAVEIDWSNQHAHELLARHYETLGDHDAATRHRQAAASLNP